MALTTGYGVAATSVSTSEDFVTAFQKALGSGRPFLIEVTTGVTDP